MSEVPGNDRLGADRAGMTQPPAPSKRKPRATTAKAKAPAIVESAPQAPQTNGATTPRLLSVYRSEIVPAMTQEFNYRNPMEVPRLAKVMLNVGLGEALTNSRAIEHATSDLATISGQKFIVTKAAKSIAGFKLREGSTIGACVTLRRARMFHFVDRLFNAALPRIRDFRGLSRSSFDGRGNYSLGIREQLIFPEIDYGQIDRIRGFQVTFVTTARTDAEAARLLELLGMPFVRQVPA